jgi:hypothetical protein
MAGRSTDGLRRMRATTSKRRTLDTNPTTKEIPDHDMDWILSEAPTDHAWRRGHEMSDTTVWFYEEKGGLLIVHEIRDVQNGAYIRTDQFTIPWRKVLASVARYERSKP